MADRTKIEWAANADGTPGASWNPIRARNRADGRVGWFCVHKSDGCKLCYAERFNDRLGTGVAFKAQNRDQVEIFLDEKMLTQPLRWKKPRTIFVCSMTDLFGEFVRDEMIERVLRITVQCPQHTFIVLTKRTTRMRSFLGSANPTSAYYRFRAKAWPLPNVWLGVSAEDQRTADERIPDLLQTPAVVRLLSAEPLLGPIDLTMLPVSGAHVCALRGARPAWQPLDWVIAGGESGQGARPMHPDWARGLRDQCAAANAAFFFKQWGEWIELDHHVDGPIVHTIYDGTPEAAKILARCKHPAWLTREGRFIAANNDLLRDVPARLMDRIGKKAAGRILDGRTHDDRPSFTRDAP